ncbi:unnamed protein product [Auanema sp. JU1783]|nr:unnamed protein product [Auanema sp. JU1783]
MKFGLCSKNKENDEATSTEKLPSIGFFDIMRFSKLVDWLLLLVGITFSLLNGSLLPLNSLIFQGITNVLIEGQGNYAKGTLDTSKFSSDVLHYCLLYFLLGLTIFIVSYIANASMFSLCERKVYLLRQLYLKAVMNQDMTWFDKQQHGALTQKMTSGTEKIKDGYGDKLGLITGALSTFVCGLTVGFSLSWQMTLLMLICVPLLAASMLISGKLLAKASQNEMSAFSEAGSLATEVIGGIRTVMAFNAQPYEVNRYETQLHKARKLGIRKAYVNSMFAAVPLALMFGTMALAFWYGTKLVVDGTVSPGTIFGVFWAVMLGTIRISSAAPQLESLLSAKLSLQEILAVIDRKPEINSQSSNGSKPDKLNGHIWVENLEFAYPSRPSVQILKDVSFEVLPGQSVALVGASGCGKSTILGILQRFYEQEIGKVLLDDKPISEYNIEYIRDKIGVVQQDPVIFYGTVAENIRLGDQSITDEDLDDVCKQANAYEFVHKLAEGYNTVIGESAVQLSGGQKQRIAIARALARKPKILLLDEATSALDTESERVVQNALDKAREGRTTICVAHRLSTVRNADQIFVFDKGIIVQRGNHDELIEDEQGIYAQMVRMQEVEQAEDDTTLDDVDPSDIHRGYNKSNAIGDDERMSRKEMQIQSQRLRISMISAKSQDTDFQIEDAREELSGEGAMEASLFDIFRFSKPELPIALLGFVMAIVRGLTWPVFSIIYGKLFIVLSDVNENTTVAGLVWAFVGLALLAGGSTFMSGSLFGVAGQRMSTRLRMAVYKNILRQDAAYFDDVKHTVGSLTSRLATDAPNVQAAIDQRLSEVLQGLSSLTAGITVAFCYGWNMAPIGLATALLLVAMQSAVTGYLKMRGQKDLESALEASRVVTDTVLNVKCIQSLNKQNYIIECFKKASSEPHKRAITRGLWQSLSISLANSFFLWNFAIAYAFGLWLIRNGWSTPFIVFQVIEALNMASVSVMAAASYFPEYIRARISAGVLFAMIRQESKIDNMSHVGDIPDIKGHVSLRNVYFSYPTRRRALVLNGMTVSVKFGQTLALVGPSGCGKSTVIQMLERYYDPLCGTVAVDNNDIRDLSIRHLRDHMALVGQEPVLFNISIRDNIAYGLDDCTQEEIEKAAQLANIHQFIVSLPEGYDTLVGSRGGRLSGGQKQRISIARAIVRNPRILLLDEATSALDSESEKVVQEALDRARQGRTCIVIAHRLSTIQNADIIAVCRDGVVIEQGTHKSLLSRKGLYYKLVHKQH